MFHQSYRAEYRQREGRELDFTSIVVSGREMGCEVEGVCERDDCSELGN
jgi:hypothetical protein